MAGPYDKYRALFDEPTESVAPEPPTPDGLEKYKRWFFEPPIRTQLAEAADAAADAMPALARERFDAWGDQMDRVDDRFAGPGRSTLKRVRQQAKSMRSMSRKVASAAREEGAPEAADRLDLALDGPTTTPGVARGRRPGERDQPGGLGPTVGRAAGHAASAGKKLVSALDWPASHMRGALMPGGDWFDGPVEGQAWNDALEKAANEGHGPAKAFRGATNAAAHIVGVPLGAAVGGLGAGIDTATGSTAELGKRFRQTVDDTVEDSGDFLRLMLADPLAYFGMGVGGAAKTAAAVAGKAALRGGVSAANAASMADDVARIVGRTSRISEAFPKVQARMAVEGLDAAKVFGEGGSFLHSSRLAITDPILGKPLADIGSFGARRALQKASRPVVEAINRSPGAINKARNAGERLAAAGANRLIPGAIRVTGAADEAARLQKRALRPLFDASKRDMRAAGREARGFANVAQLEMMKEWRDLAGRAPAKRARREWIVRNIMDPALDTTADAFRANMQSLNPSERHWVNGMDAFFRGAHKRGRDLGIFGDMNLNPVSGRYFSRDWSGKFGALDDLAEAKHVKNYTPTAKRSSTGRPLGEGDADHIKGAYDPFGVGPQYVGKLSRTMAMRKYEHLAAEALGAPTVGNPHLGTGDFGKFGDVVPVRMPDGKYKSLPADLHNMIVSDFDTSLNSIGQIIRRKGGSSPAARAIADMFDTWGRGVGRMKGFVTTTRPGYHVINGWNDTVQAMADGNHAFPGWVRRADEALKGRGGVVHPTLGRLDADQVVSMARSQNLPIEDAIAGRLDLQHGAVKSHARLQRDQQHLAELAAPDTSLRARGRAKVEGVTDKAPALLKGKRGERVAGWWESRSKLAHFMWRLEKGDPASVAAARSFSTLIDYSNPDKMVKALRMGLMFPTWVWKAPQMTARIAARNPAMISRASRFVDTQLGGEPEYEPRTYVTERGPTRAGTPMMKQRFGEIREALGGNPWIEGVGMNIVPRLPFEEAPNLPLHLAAGHLDPLLLGMGPFSKAVAENVGHEKGMMRDLLTKREGPRLDAWGAAKRYLSPIAMPPLQNILANAAMYELGGGSQQGAPIATFGGHRDYVPPERGRDILAHQLTSWLLGSGPYEGLPSDPAWNLADSAEYRQTFDRLKKAVGASRRVRQARDR